MGELQNEAAIKRTEGTKKVLKSTPAFQIIREQTGNLAAHRGRTIMENWLASGDKIDAVASNKTRWRSGLSWPSRPRGAGQDLRRRDPTAARDALDSMDRVS